MLKHNLHLLRILQSLLRILSGVPIVSLTAAGSLYLIFGATWTGRCVGLSAVVLGIVLFCSIGYWNRNWFKRRRRFVAVLLTIGLLLYALPMLMAPGGGKPGGNTQNRFLHGRGIFPRYFPWNVVPEVDQVKVGMTLFPLGERRISYTESARMRSLVLPLYDEMDRDSEFRNLGSALGAAYSDIFHLGLHTGHYFAFVPGTGPFPCLIFLHGMGGNVKAPLWLLSRLARERKCVVIAPTFGLGDWDKPGGAELVADVAREVVATFPVDPKRIFLMGYSNGAMGVTRAAVHAPELFAGLIYLSPVTEDEFFSTKGFLSRKKNRNILFLHGSRDDRIPQTIVEGTVANLKRLGCDVRLKIYADEDHWLLFSQPGAVLDEVWNCMSTEYQ
jgi:predicted esterase